MICSQMIEASPSVVHQAVDIDVIPARLTKSRTLVRLHCFVSSTANVNCFVKDSVTTAKVVHVSYGIRSFRTLLASSTSGHTTLVHDNLLTDLDPAGMPIILVLQSESTPALTRSWFLLNGLQV
jgi:hypothetical protein